MTLPENKPTFDNARQQTGVVDWLHQFSPYGIVTTDRALLITGWNQWMIRQTKKTFELVVGHSLLELYPELKKRRIDRYFHTALNGQTVVLSHRFHRYLIDMPPGDWIVPEEQMPQSATISPLRSGDAIIGTIAYIEDVTERVVREKELQDQVARLEDALKQVKTLKGLLPICSHCKKIRDDKGYWNQLESYIGEHADVDFSHGICPDCLKKYYPDIDLDEE